MERHSDARCKSEIARFCCWADPKTDTRNKEVPSLPQRSVSSPVAVWAAAERGSSCHDPGSTPAGTL